LKQQQGYQNTLTSFFTGDPLFIYDPTPSVQCKKATGRKFSIPLTNQHQPQPEQEDKLPQSPISSNPITTPPTSEVLHISSTLGISPQSFPGRKSFAEHL
jgi:hypothetical protein